jgi:hypothetical protein
VIAGVRCATLFAGAWTADWFHPEGSGPTLIAIRKTGCVRIGCSTACGGVGAVMFGYFPTLRCHHAQSCSGGAIDGELRAANAHSGVWRGNCMIDLMIRNGNHDLLPMTPWI